MTIELAPSILSANFARLGEDAKAALDGGGTVIHCDVMDGHFVPNLTIGPLVVKSLRKALPNAILDCHLMIAFLRLWKLERAGSPCTRKRACIFIAHCN